MNKKKYLVGVLIISLVIFMSGCMPVKKINKAAPEDTLLAFEKAYNELDLDGMKACFDENLNSAAGDAVNLGIALISDIAGMDISGLVKLFPLMQKSGLVDQYMKENDISFQLDIEVLNTSIEDDTAVVDTVLYLNTSTGGSGYVGCVFYLTYMEDANEWLISGFSEPQS